MHVWEEKNTFFYFKIALQQENEKKIYFKDKLFKEK